MENILTKEITCKKCNETYKFQIYPIINFQDEELTKKTFSLELFKAKCPKCGAITLVQYDTIIIDLFKKNLIYLYGNENIETFYKEILPNLNKKLSEQTDVKNALKTLKHTRLVSSINELLEKLLIFDYDLDDRIVEIIKYSLYTHSELANKNIINIFFEKLEKNKLLFSCLNKDNQLNGIGIPIDAYNKFIDDTQIKPEVSNTNFDKVDKNLILEIIKSQQNEKEQ